MLPPQTMPDERGKPSGYAVEILQQVAARLGWVLSIEYMLWEPVLDETRHQRYDLAMTVLYFQDYARFLHFPHQSILDQKNVLIVLRESNIRFDGDLGAFMHRHSIGVAADKRVNDQFQCLRNQPWVKVEEKPFLDSNPKLEGFILRYDVELGRFKETSAYRDLGKKYGLVLATSPQ